MISLLLALVMVLGLIPAMAPAASAAGTGFTDVEAGSFYEKPVEWAVENGITKGVDDTHFGPDQICNRAQVVTFLYRCFANKDKPLTIMTQPVDAVARVGEWVSFKVAVTGGKTPYSYQWYLKAQSGQWYASTNTTNTYKFEVNAITVLQSYSFYCVITDAEGNTVTTDTVLFSPG